MHRAIPQSSKLLAKKWAQQEREIHLRKLHEAKPSLDTVNLPRHGHLYQRGKRDQILEGRRGPPETDSRRSSARTAFYLKK